MSFTVVRALVSNAETDVTMTSQKLYPWWSVLESFYVHKTVFDTSSDSFKCDRHNATFNVHRPTNVVNFSMFSVILYLPNYMLFYAYLLRSNFTEALILVLLLRLQ